jgi:hypothetical protein
VTESLVKRYGVPLIVLSPIATGAVLIAYIGQGRFDMPRDAPLLDLNPPTLDIADVTTVDASEEGPPASVPLPNPSGVAMRSALPSPMMFHEDPPEFDIPMRGPADRFPTVLFTTPATE